jgi:hypothetical protein
MTRAPVDQVERCLQCLRLEGEGRAAVEKQGAHTIIDCLENALCLAILLRGVGT